jgi:hypothetical protein
LSGDGRSSYFGPLAALFPPDFVAKASADH